MRREFPKHPIIGVGGVVIHRNRVLLVQRGKEPSRGEWSIPGGMLELGEALTEGVRREIREETGLDVEPIEHIATLDRVVRDDGKRSKVSRIRYHYVIVDYVCGLTGGKLAPASDVMDARWVAAPDLTRFRLTQAATLVIARAFEFMQKHPRRRSLRKA